MQLVSAAFSHYMNIPYQNFTEKLISGMALFNIIQNYNEEDLKRLEWIEKYTHVNIKKPLYILDRYVDPTKGNIEKVPPKYTIHPIEKPENINYDKWEINQKKITMTGDDIQYYLCEAIREVNDIVMRNMKGYEVERKLRMGEYDDDEENNMFDV